MEKRIRVLRKEGGKNIISKLEMKSPQRDLAGEEGVFGKKGVDISPHKQIPALFRAAIATQSPPPMKMASTQGPTIRGIATFSEDLLHLTKTSQEQLGLSFRCSIRSLTLSLLCFREQDRLVSCQRWEMPAYLNSLWASLSSEEAPVPMLSTHQEPDAQSQGQAWITLHRGAQRYVSTTDAPSLRTWLPWVLCILTLKRMSIW